MDNWIKRKTIWNPFDSSSWTVDYFININNQLYCWLFPQSRIWFWRLPKWHVRVKIQTIKQWRALQFADGFPGGEFMVRLFTWQKFLYRFQFLSRCSWNLGRVKYFIFLHILFFISVCTVSFCVEVNQNNFYKLHFRDEIYCIWYTSYWLEFNDF